jgi:hypothetical protein
MQDGINIMHKKATYNPNPSKKARELAKANATAATVLKLL